ncbi:MgtC/SapB family protein [Bdellovibrio svalbardensis]|uniref:MgtC/SapB family protein n=1 Tax=Bdellovibrio svalbardensis TaxID=2972972 RepID=A0ABT6DND2_9BACT|nr:MgtC/SapB family protein [Bdellovibrio svalbardensis]MDG0818151.1 MgtC/SapB family protein [Bdellovibrio svalbardensis]
MEESLKAFHFSELKNLVPDSLITIFVTLALSFLIGLEREEHAAGKYYFGGVRTFPIIGLCGYLMAQLTEGQPHLLVGGVLVLGALLWLSYRKKIELSSTAGMTTELSGLFTFLMGALIFQGQLWEATTLSVIVLLLLELKVALENLARKIPASEIYTFTRFLLISAVILPIVPNRSFTDLQLNPYYIWLIVVAISGLSYLAYVADYMLGTRRGIVLTAILGGIYSSTSTTVVLAKRSKEEKAHHVFSGAMVIASGFMYFRLVVLLLVFNLGLGQRLLGPFLVLGAVFALSGGLWVYLWKDKESLGQNLDISQRNPLELRAALIFALLFSVVSVLTVFALQNFGTSGVYVLSLLTGLTDIDPFLMSLSQSAGTVLSELTAAKGIVLAAASNNLMKGIYAALFGSRGVRQQGAVVLIVLGVLSLLALLFV